MVFVVAIYLREGRRGSRPYRMMLAAMRLALVAIVLLMIAQVTLSLKRTGLPYVAVLVDDSLSMTIVDRYAEKPRKAMARAARNVPAPDDAELSRWNLARTLLAEDDGGRCCAASPTSHKLRVYFLTGVTAQPAAGRAGHGRGTPLDSRPTGETHAAGRRRARRARRPARHDARRRSCC